MRNVATNELRNPQSQTKTDHIGRQSGKTPPGGAVRIGSAPACSPADGDGGAFSSLGGATFNPANSHRPRRRHAEPVSASIGPPGPAQNGEMDAETSSA